jgi:hypothetical protein
MYSKLVTILLLIELLALSIYNCIPLHTDILDCSELVTLSGISRPLRNPGVHCL